MKKLKIFLIVILVILIAVFSILLVKAKKNVGTNITVDSKLSKEEIYDEVLTEVTEGEEKYITHDENGNRVNKSDKMQEQKSIKGLENFEVEGLTITAKGNQTQINAKIKNNGNIKNGDCIIKLSLKKDTGVEILEVGLYLDNVAPGEQTTVTTTVTTDLANAYSYDVSKMEE